MKKSNENSMASGAAGSQTSGAAGSQASGAMGSQANGAMGGQTSGTAGNANAGAEDNANGATGNANASANANLTELVFLLDRSGSMGGMEQDTIGGFNSVLDKNKAAEGDAFVSVVLFDHVSEVLIDRKPIGEVAHLTTDDYWVRGTTALLDAVGSSVKFIDRVHRYLPESHKPGKTVFVITTDGYENASTKFTYERVKRLIDKKQKEGWEFLFLGANIDAAKEAGRLGIAADRAATYINDTLGAGAMYDAVADATCCMRSAAPSTPRMGGGWKSRIDDDTRKRGGR